MGWLDDYLFRVRRNGSADGYYETTKKQILDSYDNATNIKFVKIENLHSKARYDMNCRILERVEDTEIELLLRPEMVIELGSIVTIGSKKYIIFDFFEDKLSPTAYAKRCNITIDLKFEATQVKIGTDEMGRNVYKEIGGQTVSVPCTTEGSVEISSEAKIINYTDGKVVVYFPYLNHPTIREKQFITVFGNSYQIDKIIYDKVFNGNGVLKLVCKGVA